jgi:hypothetical protein
MHSFLDALHIGPIDPGQLLQIELVCYVSVNHNLRPLLLY